MTKVRHALTALVLTSAVTAPVAAAQPASAAPKKYKNCTALTKVYRHGVGKKGARDKTSGTPVTTFACKTKVYRVNEKSDRDKDGIACEKR